MFMDQQSDPDVLKKELYGLFKYLQRVREEIAATNRPADEELHFDNMSDQLDAIVKATEEATDTIMECLEKTTTSSMNYVNPSPMKASWRFLTRLPTKAPMFSRRALSSKSPASGSPRWSNP